MGPPDIRPRLASRFETQFLAPPSDIEVGTTVDVAPPATAATASPPAVAAAPIAQPGSPAAPNPILAMEAPRLLPVASLARPPLAQPATHTAPIAIDSVAPRSAPQASTSPDAPPPGHRASAASGEARPSERRPPPDREPAGEGLRITHETLVRLVTETASRPAMSSSALPLDHRPAAIAAAAAAPAAASRPVVPEPDLPPIEITIGRIEVRAIDGDRPARNTPPPTAAAPMLPLSEYLRRREGRGP